MKCLSIWRISILGGAFEQGRARKGEEGGVSGVKRFRSQLIFKYTSAVRSKICRGLYIKPCKKLSFHEASSSASLSVCIQPKPFNEKMNAHTVVKLRTATNGIISVL